MRHRKSFNHLGRTSSHRKAMLSNMAASLILHKRITTTVAKAKALRSYVEPLITKAKHSATTKTTIEEGTHLRRTVFSYLQNKTAVTELFKEVSPKVGDRPGGYTRIIKLGKRLGDNAEMAMLELVDYNELLLTEKSAKKTKTTRRRRAGTAKKNVEETKAAAPAAAKSTEDIAETVETVEVTETVEDIKKEEEPAENKAEAGEVEEEKDNKKGE